MTILPPQRSWGGGAVLWRRRGHGPEHPFAPMTPHARFAGTSPRFAQGVSSSRLEPMRERIALVDEDGVDAVLARPAGDRRHDGVVVADPRCSFDPAVEQRADDALMHELVADLAPPARPELGPARCCAGAARGAVDRLVAVEHRVARMGARIAGLAGPHHVAHVLDR